MCVGRRLLLPFYAKAHGADWTWAGALLRVGSWGIWEAVQPLPQASPQAPGESQSSDTCHVPQQYFSELRASLIDSQPLPKQEGLAQCFRNLMEGVEQNLSIKNRDR